VPRDANVYTRDDRPHYFVAYFCTRRLKRVHEATPFRVDDPTGKRKAHAFAAAKSEAAIAFRGAAKREIWNAWVPRYVNDRYRSSPLSLKRAANAWAWLNLYLVEKSMHVPATVTHEHVMNYIPWRLGHTRHCGKAYSRNTAITELKIFGVIMDEAVRRDYCLRNPCARLRLRRDPPKEKPELTDEEIALIRAECARREAHLPIAAQWMTTSFEIALHTWCRLSSTQIPMHLVDLERGELTVRAKGGKMQAIPIHENLVPRLRALRAAKAPFTCVLPRLAAKEWWALRQKIGIGHTCFHSTRVSGISRARRAGVPESFAMRIAGHKNPTVHRIYQREQTGELAAHLNKVKFAPAPEPTPGAQQTPGGSPTT